MLHHNKCDVVNFSWRKLLPRGSWRGGPNPISQEIVFFQIPAQIPQSQPVLLKLKSRSHFSIVLFFMNPSPSAQNPISQPLKKANPSSHFTPSRPSTKEATDALQCKIHLFIWTSHKFCRKAGVSMECWVLSRFKMNGRRIIEWLSVLQDFFF